MRFPVWAALLFLWGPSRAAQPLYEWLPQPIARDVKRLEDDMRQTATGRRLLIEAQDTDRQAAVDGLPDLQAVRLLRIPQLCLVFDVRRLAKVSQWDFELAFARELAKAALNIPLELSELEMAARQQELLFALDKAGQDAALAMAWREKILAMQARLSRQPESDRVLYPPPTPRAELDRAAYDAALFLKAPEQFYWAIERDTAWSAGMVRLTELEDFIEKNGPQLGSAKTLAGTPYAKVAGRRYPARLLSAARPFLELGGLSHAREALGQFDTVAAFDLRQRLEAWLAKPS
jgi:hypothetical protein